MGSVFYILEVDVIRKVESGVGAFFGLGVGSGQKEVLRAELGWYFLLKRG